MNNEMKIKYLYFLTKMYSGTKRWDKCYEAWTNLMNNMGSREYSDLVGKVIAFNKHYAIKKVKR